MTVVGINFGLIFYQIYIGLRKAYRKRIWLKRWDEHFKVVCVVQNNEVVENKLKDKIKKLFVDENKNKYFVKSEE